MRVCVRVTWYSTFWGMPFHHYTSELSTINHIFVKFMFFWRGYNLQTRVIHSCTHKQRQNTLPMGSWVWKKNERKCIYAGWIHNENSGTVFFCIHAIWQRHYYFDSHVFFEHSTYAVSGTKCFLAPPQTTRKYRSWSVSVKLPSSFYSNKNVEVRWSIQ